MLQLFVQHVGLDQSLSAPCSKPVLCNFYWSLGCCNVMFCCWLLKTLTDWHCFFSFLLYFGLHFKQSIIFCRIIIVLFLLCALLLYPILTICHCFSSYMFYVVNVLFYFVMCLYASVHSHLIMLGLGRTCCNLIY